MPEPVITVQDTASWVAMYRALESERPDALFTDPLARKLAGERGPWIMANMPKARTYAWPMVVRTAVMDAIILRLTPAFDAVLNLAAGLDARPYRLSLPPALHWIEVDFPETIDFKASALKGDQPACVLERVPLDLADRAARRRLFTRVGVQNSRVLVISEGLLVYLDAGEVGALAEDLTAQRNLRSWLTDIASPFIIWLMKRTWGRRLASGVAFKFAPHDAAAFFAQHGWRIAEYRSNLVEGGRLHRLPMAWLYRTLFPRMWHDESVKRNGPMAGVILLENANAPE